MPVHFLVFHMVMNMLNRKVSTETTMRTSAQRGASIYSRPSFSIWVPKTVLFACGSKPIQM